MSFVSTRQQWCFPITTRMFSEERESLTGKTFGRLRVIGKLDHPARPNRLRWVVRCACGFYEIRRTKPLIKMPPDSQMCSQCSDIEERRAGRGPELPEVSFSSRQSVTVEIIKETRCTIYKKVTIPAEIRWRVWERDDFTCKYCGVRKNLSVDHIFPESKGGLLLVDNLQTLCRRCNSRKGARLQ